MSEAERRADPKGRSSGPARHVLAAAQDHSCSGQGSVRQADQFHAADLRLARDLEQYLAARSDCTGSEQPPAAPEELAALVEVFCHVQALLRKLATQGTQRAGSEPPERIGKYEVCRLLGSGGQAQSWLSFDPDLRRHAVIKLYHDATSEKDREAVLREGRALARVRSPYIAQCYGVDRLEDGTPYLVLEYTASRGLDEVAADRQLLPEQAVALIAQLAEGLAAVHGCGLLHHDITPANVLIGDDGIPRLVDFGLAEPPGSGKEGSVQGTPQFMPPEQARGEPDRIDTRSDIFGLGSVLYWLLTGQAPFEADDPATAWHKARVGEMPSVKQLAPQTPAWIAAVCMRCLAAKPEERFASANDLLQAIREHRSVRRPIPWIVAIVGIIVAGMALTLAAFWEHYSSSPAASPGRTAGGVSESGPAVTESTVSNALAAPGAILHPERRFRKDFALSVRLGGRAPSHNEMLKLPENDTLTLTVEADHDSYIGVWWLASSGSVVRVFPNRYEHDNALRAGKSRSIPGNDRYLLRVPGPDGGVAHFYALAASESWPLSSGPANGPFTLFHGAHDLERWRDSQQGALLVPRRRRILVSEALVPFRVVAANSKQATRAHRR